MIDTLVASCWELPAHWQDVVASLHERVGGNYIIRDVVIPYSKAKQYNYAYKRVLKLEHRENPRKYFLIKINPVEGMSGIPEGKIKTEASLFGSNMDFQRELFNSCDSELWRYMVRKSQLTAIHVHCDTIRYTFNEVKAHTNYSYSRNPHIATNSKSGNRTLYLSKNNYFYEKECEVVRGEVRLVGTEKIKAMLGASTLLNINDVKFDAYKKVFSRFQFVNPFVLSDKRSWNDYELYQHFLYRLNDTRQSTVRTRKKMYLKSRDSFVNAKIMVDKVSGQRFSKVLIPKLGKSYINLEQDLIENFNKFKGGQI